MKYWRHALSKSFYIVAPLLVVALIGCSQPATPTPTVAPKATAAPKAAATTEAKPAAKDAKPQAKETQPVKEAAKAPGKAPKIKVAYSAGAGAQTPMWVAKEQGLFEKHGVDVDLVYIANSATVTPALLSGEIQSAILAGGSIIDASLAGSDLVIIGVAVNMLPFSLFGQPNIQRVEDLRGKTIGVTQFGSSIDFSARQTVKKFGLEPDKDVAIVQLGGTPETMAGMKAGAVQAVVTGPPNSLTLKKLGMRELVNLADLGIPYPTGAVPVSKKYLAANKEVMTNFMKGFVEGIAVSKKDKDLTMKVVGQYTKTDDMEVLAETYDLFVGKLLPRVPYATVEGVQTVLGEAAQRNPKAKEAKPDIFIDNSILKQLEDSGFVKRLYGE